MLNILSRALVWCLLKHFIFKGFRSKIKMYLNVRLIQHFHNLQIVYYIPQKSKNIYKKKINLNLNKIIFTLLNYIYI